MCIRDRYKQWQTIYKQSQVQLDLLAPNAENKDLFYRRLREGNKDNWLDELAHSEREIASIEDKLATLYAVSYTHLDVYKRQV